MAVTSAARVAERDARAGAVLIGFADALAAPEVAWSLIDAGHQVVAFARRGSWTALRHCRGATIIEVTAPEQDAEAAVTDLLGVLGRGEFEGLMPLDDAAVMLCDRAVQRGAQIAVVGPTGEQARLALDKSLQVAAAIRAGFDVPPTRVVQSADEVLGLEQLPVILKAAQVVAVHDGSLVRGSGHVCGNRAELEVAVRRWGGRGPLLAQPLITGVGEGLFGIASAAGITALSAHRRIRMANPQGSGSSACETATVDPELARCAEAMLTEIGWTGMFMLEFLRDRDGTAWFMELNGRPWGSMALARRAGLEYPAWAVRQTSDPGFEPAPVAVPEGQVCRHLGREIVHLLFVLRGPKSVALVEWPSRRRALRDVLTVHRGQGWYNLRPRERRLFVEDTIRTVVSQVAKKRARA